MTDDELAIAFAAAQRGDEDGFRDLYRHLNPVLLRMLRAMVGADAAEDVASDAWLQIARDIGSFRGSADGFRGWCATIARNRALDHKRRAAARPVSAAQADQICLHLPGTDDTEATALHLVDGDPALAMLATLPPDQAEAVLLRVIVGLDANAAAEVLGKRPGAVRTAAHRGLKALGRRLTNPAHGIPAPQKRNPPPGVTSAPTGALKDLR